MTDSASLGEFLREVVLGLSATSAGLAIFLVVENARSLASDRRWFHVWPMLMLGGYAIVVALVAELVFGVQALSAEWRTYLYAAALASSSVGMAGTALTLRKYGKRETDHRRR